MYSANLKVGDEYSKLRRTISIIIVDGELPEFKGIKKAQNQLANKRRRISKYNLDKLFLRFV